MDSRGRQEANQRLMKWVDALDRHEAALVEARAYRDAAVNSRIWGLCLEEAARETRGLSVKVGFIRRFLVRQGVAV